MEKEALLFSVFSEVDPSPTLCDRILASIALARRKTARITFAIQTGVCFVSGMALVPLAHSVGEELYTSGFYSYASLFFSADTGIISGSWKELVYSLIESLPSVALLGTFFAAGALVWSLRHMLTNSKDAFRALPTTS